MRQTNRDEQRAVAEQRAGGATRRCLGGDDFGGAPLRQRFAGGTRRELESAAPECADAGRTSEAPAHGRLSVDLVWVAFGIGGNVGWLAGAHDQAFERVDGGLACERDPAVFVSRDGDLADRARLRPRKLRPVVGARDGRKRVETGREPGGALQRPRRHAEPLARVVAEAHEAEPTVRPAPHQLARRTPELAAHRRFAAAREPELDVQALGEARPLGLEGSVHVGRGTIAARDRIVCSRAPKAAYHPAEAEESPGSSSAALSGGDHGSILDEILNECTFGYDSDGRTLGEDTSHVKNFHRPCR